VKHDRLVIVSDTPWYAREESGRQMVLERRASFARHYGTNSDSIESLEYLTPDRLLNLEERLSIQLTAYSPWYGFKWAMRPLMAKLRGKREPSRFRIYVAERRHARFESQTRSSIPLSPSTVTVSERNECHTLAYCPTKAPDI
jgi:hypothetical protein